MMRLYRVKSAGSVRRGLMINGGRRPLARGERHLLYEYMYTCIHRELVSLAPCSLAFARAPRIIASALRAHVQQASSLYII